MERMTMRDVERERMIAIKQQKDLGSLFRFEGS